MSAAAAAVGKARIGECAAAEECSGECAILRAVIILKHLFLIKALSAVDGSVLRRPFCGGAGGLSTAARSRRLLLQKPSKIVIIEIPPF